MENKMNSLYGLSTTFTTEGLKNFWKQGEAFCKYMQDLERKMTYKDTDAICYPEDLVKSDVKMYEHLRKEQNYAMGETND